MVDMLDGSCAGEMQRNWEFVQVAVDAAGSRGVE